MTTNTDTPEADVSGISVTAAASVPAAAPTDFPVTLDEFCTRLSTADKRVELIGAFHSVEKAARRHRDTEANYQARFDAFINQPA